MDLWKKYNEQFITRTVKIMAIALLTSAVLSKDLMSFPLWFFAIFLLLDMVFMRVDKYLNMIRLNMGR